jgi:hypothetical protein
MPDPQKEVLEDATHLSFCGGFSCVWQHVLCYFLETLHSDRSFAGCRCRMNGFCVGQPSRHEVIRNHVGKEIEQESSRHLHSRDDGQHSNSHHDPLSICRLSTLRC